MKAATLLVTIALTAPLLSAADAPRDKTFGFMNGRYWNSLDSGIRPLCLVGISDGWSLRGTTEEIAQGLVIDAFAAARFSFSDLSNMVTSVYSETENIDLPIGWVALAIIAIERGENDRNVFTALRKQMATLLGSTRSLPNTDFDPLPHNSPFPRQ